MTRSASNRFAFTTLIAGVIANMVGTGVSKKKAIYGGGTSISDGEGGMTASRSRMRLRRCAG